jgi:hypothetical protein
MRWRAWAAGRWRSKRGFGSGCCCYGKVGAAGECGKGVKPNEVATVMAAAAIEEIRKTPKRASSQLGKGRFSSIFFFCKMIL